MAAIIVVERHYSSARQGNELEGVVLWGQFTMEQLLTYRIRMKQRLRRVINANLVSFKMKAKAKTTNPKVYNWILEQYDGANIVSDYDAMLLAHMMESTKHTAKGHVQL